MNMTMAPHHDRGYGHHILYHHDYDHHILDDRGYNHKFFMTRTMMTMIPTITPTLPLLSS